MANGIIQNASGAGVASTANTTQFWMPLGATTVDTVETNQQVIFRNAGTITNFYVDITANGIGATPSIIITFRKNAGNGNQSVSPGFIVTGYIEDTTNTDTIASGDLVCVKSVPQLTTNTFTINQTGHHYASTTSTVTRLVSSGALSVSTSAATRFFQLHGILSDTATEANTKCRMRKAGTLKNLAVNVTTNSRTTTSTYQSRKGGVNGNLTVTYLTTVTGLHEDTSNSDVVAVADDWNWTLIYGSGSTAYVTQSIAVDFISTALNAEYITGRSGGIVYNKATNTFDPISGGLKSTATEAQVQTTVRSATTFSELNTNVTANTVTNAGSLTFRDGSTNTALTVTITASTAQLYSDTTHTVAVAVTDAINWNVVPGTLGTSMTVCTIIASSLYTASAVNQTVYVEWEEA